MVVQAARRRWTGLTAVSCLPVCLPGVVHGPHSLEWIRPDLQPRHSTIFPEKRGQNWWRGEEPEGRSFQSCRQVQRRRLGKLRTPTRKLTARTKVTKTQAPLTLGLCSLRPQLREPQQTSYLRRRRAPKQEPWCPQPLIASLNLSSLLSQMWGQFI